MVLVQLGGGGIVIGEQGNGTSVNQLFMRFTRNW